MGIGGGRREKRGPGGDDGRWMVVRSRLDWGVCRRSNLYYVVLIEAKFQ